MSNYICSLTYNKNPDEKFDIKNSVECSKEFVDKLNEIFNKKDFLKAEIRMRDDITDEEHEHLMNKGINLKVLSVYCTSDEDYVQNSLSKFVRGYFSCARTYGILTKE